MSETVKIHKLLDSDGALFSPYVVKDSVFNADGTPYFLQDTQTTPHASQHAAGGADPVTPAMIGAYTTAETDAALQLKSNPNLLDNWCFADPIDQRGGYVVPPNEAVWSNDSVIGYTDRYYKVESFDGTNNAVITFNNTAACTVDGTKAVRGYAGAGYTIDRWKMAYWNATNPKVLISEGGITISTENAASVANAISLNQAIEHPECYAGREVTLSFLLGNLTVNSTGVCMGFYVNGTAYSRVRITSADANQLKSKTITVPTDVSSLSVRIEQDANNGGAGSVSINVIAVKLELGSQQTLAHQDADGNWVLNDPPPNKQQELAKCQRYQVVYAPSAALTVAESAVTRGKTTPNFSLRLPTCIRATPTVSFSDLVVRNTHDGTTQDVTSATIATVSNDIVVLGVLVATATDADTDYSLRVLGGGKLILDANL